MQDPAYDMGEDKNHYVLYQGGDDYKTYMMKLTDGQEPMMLLDQVFSVKNDQGYYDVRPDFAAVSRRDLFSVSQQGNGCTRLKENLVLHCPSSGVPWNGRERDCSMGNRYITYSESHLYQLRYFPACRRPLRGDTISVTRF